jgi:ribosomal protein S30
VKQRIRLPKKQKNKTTPRIKQDLFNDASSIYL